MSSGEVTPEPRLARAMRVAVVIGLLVGTASHVENIARSGAIPRPELPLAYNWFWTALVVLDPIAAALVWARPRVGLAMTLAIMVADLAINLDAFGLNAIVATQLAFAGLVVATIAVRRRASR